MCRVGGIAIVVALNLDLQSEIIPPRELHKRGIVVARRTNSSVVRQQHDEITPLADEFGEWLDAHPEFAVACVCLCIGLCAAAAVLWGR